MQDTRTVIYERYDLYYSDYKLQEQETEVFRQKKAVDFIKIYKCSYLGFFNIL